MPSVSLFAHLLFDAFCPSMALSGAPSSSSGLPCYSLSASPPSSSLPTLHFAPPEFKKIPCCRSAHRVLLSENERKICFSPRPTLLRNSCPRNGLGSSIFQREKRKRRAKNRGRDGFLVSVRGKAEVEAEFEAGVDGEENGRRAWSGEQDNKKAKALKDSSVYPIMRVYRDDLCTLEVTGDAKAWRAIEAMAADGGATAGEELAKGRSLMTVETIIPGRRNNHSTVSTKLLAPTQLVTERAKTMWAYKRTSMSTGNALARSFETVVMQNLLSFDIHVHSPGSVRDMANLAHEKEDAVIASLECRDASVLEGLAEAVCAYSLATIKDNYDGKVSGKGMQRKRFALWRKSEWVWALSKGIGICPLSENEIWVHTMRILDEPAAMREVKRTYQAWWPASASSLPKDFLPPRQGLNGWITEFIPVHKILIDTRKVKAVPKGWQITTTEQVLELHLTHAQLVDLADMLDIYFEDAFTTPAKSLRSGVQLTVSHLTKSKVTKTLWTAASSLLAGGILLVGLLIVARLKTSASRAFFLETSSTTSSSSQLESSFAEKWCHVRTDRQALLPKNEVIPAEEMEALCRLVVHRVKDAFHLSGQIESSPNRGAWIGSDFTQLRTKQRVTVEAVDKPSGDGQLESQDGEKSEKQNPSEGFELDSLVTMTDKPLLLYQVVLARDGRVCGFQPENPPAIKHWVEYPFARELHKGHHLGSGLFEHGLKYRDLSEDVVAIELLCQRDLESISVTARPLQL